MANTFVCPKDCNDNPGRKEKTKNAVMQEGKNKPMGEKMTMKGRDTKMATNNSGEMYQKWIAEIASFFKVRSSVIAGVTLKM